MQVGRILSSKSRKLDCNDDCEIFVSDVRFKEG